MKDEKTLILNENMWKLCFKLSIPAIIAMMLYGVNVVIDAIFVSNFVGDVAFTGVSAVYPLSQFTLGLGSLAGSGAGALLSILIGRNDKETQKRLVGNTNTLMIILSIIATVLGFLFVKNFVELLNLSDEASNFGLRYFYITISASFLWISALAYNMIIRAEGKMKTAAIIMGVGMLANIVFNYILMAVFKLGVDGAAIGTNIGMFVYVALFFVYVIRGKASFPANPFRLYFDKHIIKQIFSLGFPALLMSIMNVIQGMVILNQIAKYGRDIDIAFYGAVLRVSSFSLTPIFGLMRSLQPTAGINFGAGNYKRVRESYLIYSIVAFIIMLPLWIASLLFPSEIISLLLNDFTARSQDIMNLRIFMSINPILAFVLTAMTFFPAINKPAPAGIIGLGRQLFLYIPLMYFLPKFFGIDFIYLGSFMIDVFIGLIVIFLVMREFRNLKKLERLDTKAS